MVKNLPEVQETWVRFPGLGRSPGGGMTAHSSILAWRIPLTEEPGGLLSMGSQRAVTVVDTAITTAKLILPAERSHQAIISVLIQKGVESGNCGGTEYKKRLAFLAFKGHKPKTWP